MDIQAEKAENQEGEIQQEIMEQITIDGRIQRYNIVHQYSSTLKILNLANISETEYLNQLPQQLTQITFNNCQINNIRQISCKSVQFLTAINCNLTNIIGIEQFQFLKQANFQRNNIKSLTNVLQHDQILTFNILQNPIMNKLKNTQQQQILFQSYFPNIRIFNNIKVEKLQFESDCNIQHLLGFYEGNKVYYEQIKLSQQQSIKLLIDQEHSDSIKLEIGASNAKIVGVYLVKFLELDQNITTQYNFNNSVLTLNKEQMISNCKLVFVMELNGQLVFLVSSRNSPIKLSEAQPQTFKQLRVQNYEQLRGKQIQFIQLSSQMVVSDKNDFTPFIQGFYNIKITTFTNQIIQYQFYVSETQDIELIRSYLQNESFSCVANYLGCNILCVHSRVYLYYLQNFLQYLVDSNIHVQINWKFYNKAKEYNEFVNQFTIVIPENYINYKIMVEIIYFDGQNNKITQQIINILDEIIAAPKLVNYYRFIKPLPDFTYQQEDLLNTTYQLMMYNAEMVANSVLELQIHKMFLLDQKIYKVKWFTSELTLFQIENLNYFKNVYEEIKYYKSYSYQNNVLILTYEDPISGKLNDLRFYQNHQHKDTPYYYINDADIQKFILVFINFRYLYISHIPVMQDCMSPLKYLEGITLNLSHDMLVISYTDKRKTQIDILADNQQESGSFTSKNLLSKYSFSSNSLLLRQQNEIESQCQDEQAKASKQNNVITYSCYDITINLEYIILVNNENVVITAKQKKCQMPFKLSYRDMYEEIKQFCNNLTQQIKVNVCIGVRNKIFDKYAEKIESFVLFNKQKHQIQRFLQQAGIKYNIDPTPMENIVIEQRMCFKQDNLKVGNYEYKQIFNQRENIQPKFNTIVNQLDMDLTKLYFEGKMIAGSTITMKNLSIDSHLFYGFLILNLKQSQIINSEQLLYKQLINTILQSNEDSLIIFNTNFISLEQKYINKYICFFIIDIMSNLATVIKFENSVSIQDIVEHIYISQSENDCNVLYKSKYTLLLNNSYIYFPSTQTKVSVTSNQPLEKDQYVLTFNILKQADLFNICMKFDSGVEFVLKDVLFSQKQKLQHNKKAQYYDQFEYHNYINVDASPSINAEAVKMLQESKGPLQVEQQITEDTFDDIYQQSNMSLTLS